MRFTSFLLAFSLLFFTSVASIAQIESFKESYVQTELVSDYSQVTAGQKIRVGMKYTIDPTWHIYWSNPGDTGIPTTIEWLAKSGEVSNLFFPTPEPIPTGPLMNYGYADEVIVYADVQVPADASGELFFQAESSFLVCREICLPGQGLGQVSIAVGENAVESKDKATFDLYAAQTPENIKMDVSYSFYGDDQAYVFKIPKGEFTKDFLRFIPDVEGVIDDSHEQFVTEADDHFKLVVMKDKFAEDVASELNGVIVFAKHVSAAVDLQITQIHEASAAPVTQSAAESVSGSDVGSMTLMGAILFAFLGGLILNLMPCVLPVLSLKVMGLVHHTQSKFSWFYGLVYTAGILTTFYLFAYVLIWLKSQGVELGWGFQLQSPMFVATLALILFLVALELFSVYEIGTTFGRLQNVIGRKNSVLTTFLSGMLITVVATPCTVPFMGGAVAFSLGQDAGITYKVFLALGFGLAFPYLLLTFIPKLAGFLPKPGPWEEKFQEFLGFPMIATAIWLTWVYAKQTSLDELFMLLSGLTVVAFGAWSYGHLGSLNSSFLRKAFAFVLFYFCLFLGIASYGGHKVIAKDVLGSDIFETQQSDANLEWKPWDADLVEAYKNSGKPVFVNFTADWCISCKANEAATLDRAEMQTFFKENDITLIKADWTKQDDVIRQELDKYGRKGVPLYLVIKAGKVTVLPQILTFDVIKQAYK